MPEIKLTSDLLSQGRVLREPAAQGKGYWVGAPGVRYEPGEKAWYLCYRVRRPRGIEPDRGGEARIARSTDLKQFDDVWTVTKDRYASASIERSYLLKGPDGLWRYFTSFVDPADGRWCTEVLKAGKVEDLDPSRRERVFTAKPLGLEGVKDPWIMQHEGVFYMFLSVATPTPKTGDSSHSTLDIFNTGECVSATALAVSRDLDHWDWRGVVLRPGTSGWDVYCRRINSVIRHRGRFFAFYDGSGSHLENYEERTALATSDNIESWKSLCPEGPFVTSPHASKSLRYLDAQVVAGRVHLFYEFARPDGAHDLRVVEAKADSLALP